MITESEYRQYVSINYLLGVGTGIQSGYLIDGESQKSDAATNINSQSVTQVLNKTSC